MCYQNELRFNGVYSRDNLPNTIKDGSYIINLDEYFDIGTHWIASYVNNKTAIYFDSFGVEHSPKEIKIFIDNKNIITNIIANIFRIQAYDLIMCGYFCTGFIDFMFQTLLIFFHQIISKKMMIYFKTIFCLIFKNGRFC